MASRNSRRDHDGRMDPTGSGQSQQGNNSLSLPQIKKRSKFRRSAPRRFVDTERNIESNRPSTQQDERPQGVNPSASQSVHLPTLVGTAMRTRENPSPIRGSASSPNRLILPPIEHRDRVPTPHPPQQTPGSSRGRRTARYSNMSDREGSQSGQSGAGSRPNSGVYILRIEFQDPPEGYAEGQASNQASRASAVASRTANSANRSRDTSRLDNVSRLSGLQGSASAKSSSRDNAPSKSSVRSSPRQPVPPTGTYQHQGSNSDGALIIRGIRKPTAPSGRVCNSNNLRRHSTGGKIVPPQEKDNKGLFVIENGFLKPTPPAKPKSESKTSQNRASKTSLKPKRSSNPQSNTSLKSKGSSKHQSKTLQVDVVESKRSSNPQSNTPLKLKRSSNHQSKTLQVEAEVEESKRSSNPQSNTSLKSKRSSNHQSKTLQVEAEVEVEVEYENDFEPMSEEDVAAANNSRAASSRSGSRPPSSIPEEIEGQDGRYDYADETFEVDEDDERPLSVIREAGSRADSGASIPEELPGQSRPGYDYNDDDTRPESDIPEDIVTSDDHDDDEDDDDVSPTSRC